MVISIDSLTICQMMLYGNHEDHQTAHENAQAQRLVDKRRQARKHHVSNSTLQPLMDQDFLTNNFITKTIHS